MPAREALKLGAEEGWEGALGLLSLCLGPPGPQFRVAAAGLVSRNPTQGPAPGQGHGTGASFRFALMHSGAVQ